MAKRGPAAERLRAFVRERVSKDGAHYAWGNAARLAEALKVGAGWVNRYAVENTAHANLDQVLAICRFYGLTLADLSKPKALAPPPQAQLNPAIDGLAEALAQGLAPETALALVNAGRDLAGLPALALPPARTRAGSR